MNDRLGFIEWMKFLGMGVIVWGHCGGESIVQLTEPFNAKQLGVAFFIFVLGYTLACETRQRFQVCFNRLFPVLLVGFMAAVSLSVIDWFRVGDLRESNYLPLFFGSNVLFNFFPSNPTTWYIGTYFHLVLLWTVLLYRLHITIPVLIVSIVTEVAIRALLIDHVGRMIAYMLLTNWFTILLMGIYCGQPQKSTTETNSSTKRTRIHCLFATVSLVLLLGIWSFAIGQVSLTKSFPFQLISFSSDTTSAFATSSAVSFLYFSITMLVYQITRGLGSSRIVAFFARNTLFVFIVHMPLIYALTPFYYPYVTSPIVRMPLNLLCFFVVPAVISEVLFRVVPLKSIRDACWNQIEKRLPAQSSLEPVPMDRTL